MKILFFQLHQLVFFRSDLVLSLLIYLSVYLTTKKLAMTKIEVGLRSNAVVFNEHCVLQLY